MVSSNLKRSTLHALGHTFLVVIISAILFNFTLENNPLVTLIAITVVAVTSYSTFLILLLNYVVKHKPSDIDEANKIYLYSVISLSLFYGIIFLVVVGGKFNLIYILPFLGIIMSFIIPWFYKKK